MIFAEGLRTEEQYLVHWHRRNRTRVAVTIDEFRGGPLQLVQRAVSAKKNAARDERRGRGRAYDQIWCIHDVDEHPHLNQAAALAEDHGIRLASSNPCIELWFMLHFEDQTAYVERRNAQSRARELLGCEKVLTPAALSRLEQGHAVATRRAQALDRKHDGDGSPPGSNPSSAVWRLVDEIRLA